MSFFNKPLNTYPSLLGDDGLCNDLEVVHVEDVLERRAGGPGGLPSLLLCRDLLDHLGNRARVNGTKADSKLSASWKHWLCAYDILFFDWQVSCDGIWWVDGLVCLAKSRVSLATSCVQCLISLT